VFSFVQPKETHFEYWFEDLMRDSYPCMERAIDGIQKVEVEIFNGMHFY
jgi:hypothetical protein